jgi:hypothetical protein
MIGTRRIPIALVVMLAACSQSHAGDMLDIRDPSAKNGSEASGASDGRNDAGESLEPSLDAGSSAQTDTMQPHTLQPETPLPTLLDDPAAGGRETFVGQLWALQDDIELCSPGMPWLYTKVVTDPTGHVETTTLILEHIGDPDLGGSIRFGEGEPPTDPGDAPFADGANGGFWLCSNQIPTQGVEYALHEARLFPDRLTFSIIPGEVWNPWCAKQTAPCGDRECGGMGPICQCTPDGCTSLPPEGRRPGSGTPRLNFNLAITANTIEGQIPLGSGFGTPADLRLLRAR